MTVSYNGWSASPSPSAIGIRTYTVGGGSRVALRSSVAPILVWLANYYSQNIEAIDGRQLDDWGYSYRQTRGGGSMSNHSSGTAIDINALHYPRSTNNMTSAKQEECRQLVRKINSAAGKTLIKWGGEWSGEYRDQMHFELAPNTSYTDVQRAVRNLTTKPVIWADKTISAFKGPYHAKAPTSVARVQSRLKAAGFLSSPYILGTAGVKTRAAMKAWQKAHDYNADGIPGRVQLERLAGSTYTVK